MGSRRQKDLIPNTGHALEAPLVLDIDSARIPHDSQYETLLNLSR